MIKNFDSLAGRLKGITIDGKELNPKEFTELLTSENEVELTVNEINMFTNEELETLKKNVSDPEYNKGKINGVEMAVKEAREKFGLQFEGKTIDNLISAYEAKIKKDIDKKPNEVIEEWKTKYNTLKTTYDTEKGGWDTEKGILNTKLNNIDISTTLQADMPKLNGLKPNQATMLFRAEYDLEKRDNILIAKKGGEIVKDKIGSPLPVKDLFTTFASENGWLKVPGAGGGDETGGTGKFKDKAEVYNHMRSNNIDPDSDQGKKLMESIEQG